MIHNAYPPTIEKWVFNDISIDGIKIESNLGYAFGLTPPDPNEPSCIYFDVTVIKSLLKETKEVVFDSEYRMFFKIQNNGFAPDSEFLFSLVDHATEQFATYYHEKIKYTNLQYTRVKKSTFEVVGPFLEQVLSTWNLAIRNTSLN